MDSDDFNKIINKETTSFTEMTITDNDDNEIINEYENFTNEKIEGAISSVKQVENEQEEEEIPFLDDLIQAYSSPTTSLHDIENKETKLQNLIIKAYSLFGKENVDYILSLYEKFQDDLSDNHTQELDNQILLVCKNNNDQYNAFLDLLYKIIYIKYLKQIDEMN